MRSLAVALVALIAIAACTSGTDESSDSPARDQTGSTAGDDPAEAPADVEPPAQVEAGLTGDDTEASLQVSFAPSPDAEGHLVRFDDDSEPVLVEPDDCSDDGCALVVDQLTAGGATSVTVTAVAGGQESPPSDAAELPSWPQRPEPAEPDEDEPITLVVTRADGASLTVDTETVEPGDDVEARIADLRSSEDVMGVGLDVPVPSPGAIAQADNDDHQGLEDLADQLVDLWAVTWQESAFDFDAMPESRGQGTTIAVIDSVVDPDHPALADADIVVDAPGAEIANAHGTAVTSLIVGQPGSRVPGVAPAATIRSYDWYSDRGETQLSNVARAIIQAVDDGVDVINLSEALPCEAEGDTCPALEPAINHADDRGVVVVASAPNYCEDDPEYEAGLVGPWPAKFPSVIAVGGTSRSGQPWACSDETDYVDVLAPATNLRVAWLGGGPIGDAVDARGYRVASGNSLSTPLVSGLIAAILSEQPDLEPAEIRELLAGATGEHGRLIPGAALAALGLLDEPALDFTTGKEVLPFSLELEFLEGHPVHEAAVVARDLRPSSNLFGGTRVEMNVDGILMIGEDGSVTGWGAFVPPVYPYQSTEKGGGVERTLRGIEVSCPAAGPSYLFPPTFAFYWDVRAVVGGQVSDDRRGRVDLSLSFGEGATPDTAGELPGMTVTIDELDGCAHVIDSVTFVGRSYTWDEVKAERNKVVTHAEQAYQGLVDLGPIEISDARTDGTRLQLGGSNSPVDNARLRLQVGTYRE